MGPTIHWESVSPGVSYTNYREKLTALLSKPMVLLNV